MAEKIDLDFENGRTSNLELHMTLTLDRATWHTVVHHLSTTTFYTSIFIRMGETFCGQDGRTDGRTYGRTNRHRGRLYYVDLKMKIGTNVHQETSKWNFNF